MKWAGAAYLIYLGVRAFMAKADTHARLVLPAVTPRQAFFQAVGAEVLNPKTAIFFLAFLPEGKIIGTLFMGLGLKVASQQR
ncbi:threonine/homoserine/homoserine lactone efflux protein [Pseudomonas sp. W3I7]|uniref:LysE family translocator n=1 Tax=Pseudomonas sp. W3I7 TaxID=3042292 RepID=UPI00278E475F|nr:LysE family transporter [Pseudomonas sp. W3I7]MDQ0702910.1 threonine/homoserine/homoserine lactone efflux protein [Pseudomonas sp. W3I7]